MPTLMWQCPAWPIAMLLALTTPAAPMAQPSAVAAESGVAPGAAASAVATTAPLRIVTLAPSITETVFALGCGDRVVGVSDFCDYPPEAKTRQRCGGFINPNLEILSMLAPDLVFVQGKAERLRDFCERRRIAILPVDMNSVASIHQGIATIGAALGVPERAADLNRRIEGELEALRTAAARERRPRVFLVLDRQAGSLGNLMTAGGGTFLDELLTLAGGESVFADLKTAYPQVSKEALVARQPDVILELRPGAQLTDKDRQALMAQWSDLASIPAVRDRRIVYVTESRALIPGPGVARTVEALRAALREAAATAADAR